MDNNEKVCPFNGPDRANESTALVPKYAQLDKLSKKTLLHELETSWDDNVCTAIDRIVQFCIVFWRKKNVQKKDIMCTHLWKLIEVLLQPDQLPPKRGPIWLGSGEM